jgi:hypothetical protein
MATILVLHRVVDYPTWRKAYDSSEGLQKELGVIEETVFQTKGDSNNVLVLHRFATMPEAQAFVTNPKLRDAMTQGGVIGEPRIEFYEEALVPVRA